MKNVDIRKAAADKGVRLWEIAQRLGISDGNFSRKLRCELPNDMQTRIFAIIDEIAKEAENASN